MAEKRHKKNTRTFQELDYADQARSINAQINVLVKAINAHLAKAKEEGRIVDIVKHNTIMQILRAISRIKDK